MIIFLALSGFVIVNTEYLGPVTMIIGVLLYTVMNPRFQFLAVIIGALFPIGFGRMLGGVEITLFSVSGPLMLIGLWARRRSWLSKPAIKATKLVYVGLIALVLALAASYVRNPVGTKSLMGGVGGSYGLRLYYDTAVCVLVLLLSVWAVKSNLWDPYRLIRVVMLLSTFIGILRVFSYLGYVEVPFFTGSLKYLEYTGDITSFTEGSRRIGGLDLPAGFTIISAFLLYSSRRVRIQSAFCLIVGVALLFFSGGRSAFAGVSLAVLAAIGIREVKHVWKAAIPIAIAYYLLSNISFGTERSFTESQMERILRYQNLSEETHRLEGYEYLIEAFKENPILGKGISPLDYSRKGTIGEVGGHGGFISIIGLFGVLGVLFLVLSYFNPLFYTIGRLSVLRKSGDQRPESVLLQFALFSLIFLGGILLAGGTGYSSTPLYLLIGLIAGAIDKERLAESAH